MTRLTKRNLHLNEYLEFLEEINKALKLELVNNRNSVVTCETCVSLKRK